jgi:hypothetical protein
MLQNQKIIPRSRVPPHKLTASHETLYPLRKPLFRHHVHNSQKKFTKKNQIIYKIITFSSEKNACDTKCSTVRLPDQMTLSLFAQEVKYQNPAVQQVLY